VKRCSWRQSAHWMWVGERMMDNRKSARSVSVSLLLVLALGMCVLGCNTTPSPTASVSSWIRAHALPLATTDPQASLDDLRQIPELVGTASIVGLGEETHGSHEFFTMKQRLLEVLVEKMGFTLFAMECSVSVG
jgi:erythromycin esterase